MDTSAPRTMLHALRDRALRHGDAPALWTRTHGHYQPTSWRGYEAKVRALARGLERLGFGQGKTLAILAGNREEWLVSQLGAMALGGSAVGIYTTASSEQVAYVLGHAEVEIAVVEAAHLETIRAARQSLPKLREVLVLSAPASLAYCERPFEDALERVPPDADDGWRRRIDALEPSSLATLIYTSGTTGHPKGVMLSHENLAWTAHMLGRAIGTDRDEVILSYLPLSHIAEQMLSVYLPLVWGIQVYFAESLEVVPERLKEVRPTVFFGVPRVWEKFKAKAEARLGEQTGFRKRLVEWARATAQDRTQRLLRGERVPVRLEAKYELFRRAVLHPLRTRIGLDRAWFLASGAAPISRDVLEFFASLDMLIHEVYGQSEVSGPTSFNLKDATRLGTVGRPLPGVEVRIEEDGEVLVRGKNVCLGYSKDPKATGELLSDGWLHSGDLGSLDRDGYLRITGRKKEILVTSGGKKTSPTNIEDLLKAIEPLSNPVVVGEGRNYLVALLPIDPESAKSFAEREKLPVELSQLASDARFHQYLQDRIEREVNARLARFEHIRKFAVLERDLQVSHGELTPTLKVRRKAVEHLHQEKIAALYEKA